MLKEAKLIKIGNSQGVRIPKVMISKYGFGDHVVLEEVEAGILIHPTHEGKLSWEDTYKSMIKEDPGEWAEWADLDLDADSSL